MCGRKPHLLERTVNNLGAETRIDYATSTQFYLADKAAGMPWVTRLPFPVHVVERVETYDRVSRNRFVTRYSYHHGFYDGVVFHRVIDGFMAQTGCPHGTGTGGSGKKLKAEFNSEPHVRGTASMARAASPDSADSQFFICFDDASFLNRQYTVWGQVTSGMENVDKIKRGEPVKNPDKIVKAHMAADAA